MNFNVYLEELFKTQEEVYNKLMRYGVGDISKSEFIKKAVDILKNIKAVNKSTKIGDLSEKVLTEGELKGLRRSILDNKINSLIKGLNDVNKQGNEKESRRFAKEKVEQWNKDFDKEKKRIENFYKSYFKDALAPGVKIINVR